MNLSSPDVESFHLPTQTKKTETEHMFPCFPLPRFTQRLPSGLIWKSRRPTRTSENWVDLTVLYSNFVCFSLFLMNLLRYCGIKVNGSKEQPSRFLQVQLISVWLIRYNHCKLIKLTFFVPFTKNGIFKLTKCGLSPERFLYSTQCNTDYG